MPLRFLRLAVCTLLAGFMAGMVARAAEAPVGWDTTVPAILARIKAPEFPARDFSITDYGATAGGQADCTDAIAKAIAACATAGGGRVVVPPGVFLTGAIHLKSNVNLHVSANATLKFSTNPEKYPVVFTRWEGVECMNFSPFIYALDQTNVAVTGTGTLDGSASLENWWGWTRPQAGEQLSRARRSRDRLLGLGENNTPVEQRVFGPGDYLRPNFIQPYRCKNVLIEGVTIVNSPMWEIHPVLCTNVIVRGVNINSHGVNNDGCDPESCKDVLIENCVFDTGDDCIAIKSGRNNDGRRVNAASENLIIRNCVMKDGHGGVVIGSEISGHCRNVFVENCQMDSPNLDRALRFKNNAVRGGTLENFFMRNVKVGQVREAVLTVDFVYEEGARGAYKPILRNVVLENVTATAAPRAMWIVGFPGAVIEDITFKNCVVRGTTLPEVLEGAANVTFDRTDILPANRGNSASSIVRPLP